MKKVKRLLLFFFAFALLLAAGISYGLYQYEDEVKQFVVKSLNQQIRTEIEVSSIDLTFWNSFPHASVVFHDVVIHAVDAKKDTLLAAKKLGAQFNLYELYKRKYRLTGLQIEEGKCQMVVDNSGRENYVFWQKDKSNSSAFQIDLERVNLKKMQFDYNHFQNSIHISLYIQQTSLKGSFAQSIFDLNIEAELKNVGIKNGDWTLINQRNIKLSSKGQVNDDKEFVAFQAAKLELDGMKFALDGSLGYDEESALNLRLASENTSLENALTLLPTQFKSNLSDYSVKGKATIEGKIIGSLSAEKQPNYMVNFLVSKGDFKHKSSGFHIQHLNLKGSLNNGEQATLEETRLVLNAFSAEFEGGKISLSGSLVNFNKPNYQIESEINFALSDLIRYFNLKEFKSEKGQIKGQLSINGKMKKATEYSLLDWKKAKVKGLFQLKEVNLQSTGFPQAVSQLNGDVLFENNALNIKALSLLYGHNKMEIKGRASNLIGYLLEENETLILDLSLASKELRLDDFLIKTETESSPKQSKKGNIKLYLEPNIGQLFYQDLELQEFNSNLLWEDSRLDLRNTNFSFLDGRVIGEFFLRETQNGFKTYSKTEVVNVNIKKLFDAFDNFTQQTIRSEHLEGTTTATIDYAAEWDKSWKLNEKSLKVESSLRIENGRLINFKPLESLSKYIALEELQDVRFKSLQNHILIENKTIHIPRFEVLSSALNIELEGTHNFENQIDYKFELFLNDILGKKVKKPENNEFGYVEDDGLGRTKIFMRMQGHVDDPKISYDKEQLKVHVKEKIKDEKQTLKKILNEEFGLFKNDSLVNRKEVSTEKKKSRFSVEWDENLKKDTVDSVKKKKVSRKQVEEKSKFGKFIDKIAQPNEDEYIEPKEN